MKVTWTKWALIGVGLISFSGAMAETTSIDLVGTPLADTEYLSFPQTVTGAFGAVGSSITSPNAQGGLGYSMYFGGSYVNHWSGSEDEDATSSFGGTFGNARNAVGVTIGVINDSVSDDYFEHTGISLRLNRYLNSDTSVAIGAANVYGWDIYEDVARSYYAVVTKEYRRWSLPVVASFGAGTGLFNSISDAQDGVDSNVYPFASAGLGVTENTSIIADWASRRLALGTSYVAHWIDGFPISFNASVLDVAGDSGDDGQLSLSASIVISKSW